MDTSMQPVGERNGIPTLVQLLPFPAASLLDYRTVNSLIFEVYSADSYMLQ